ncbi:hypothetical protein [Streptomyces sp. NPDC050388]|uniref:hypothetical protein n=1 Tax=Streptomyces sp. NPDC050388 TaxID=3155781 RepID=UPI00341B5E2E
MGTIKVGKSQAKPDTPTHVKGLHQGNWGPRHRQPGHHEDGKADARRSTGIHWKRHNRVMDSMPSISPG